LAHRRHLDVALQRALHLIRGKQIRRIGQTYEVFAAPVLEHDRAEAARLGFRQTPHYVAVQVVELEVDVGDVELPGERLGDLLVVAKPLVDEYAPEATPGALLLLKGDTQLLAGDQLLCDEDVP